MSLNSDQWFVEAHTDGGSAIGFEIEAHLHSEQSAFQKIDIYKTKLWGNLMVIDGFIMLTSRDNFLYHEMMSHPALFAHQDPKNVVVIGGGDCGTLKEVLRHPTVQHAAQVEIDERVTRLAEQYFPELCESNNDPRAELLFIDGIKYMQDTADESIDIIIVDSTDPIGPAEGLFGPEFVRNCYRVLGDGGIMVQQSESPLIHQNIIQPLRSKMKNAGFADVRTLPFPQPCYPSGWWSCTMARKNHSLDHFREQAVAEKPFQTNYYNALVHQAAMAELDFMRRGISL